MSRLEEIKEHYQLWRFNEKNRALPSSTGIDYEDLIYLVNRVDELEEENKQLQIDSEQSFETAMEIREEHLRYKQALETIAVGDNHVVNFEDIARWALEGDPE